MIEMAVAWQLMMWTPSLPFPMPPARFDHPFHGQVKTIYLDPDRFVTACKTAQAYACTYGENPKGWCVAFIRAEYRNTWLNKYLIQHEVGHCNGWPADHGR